MGRHPISDEPRVATAVRLPQSLHQRLHDIANERDVSANRIITKALAEYLDQIGSVDPLAKVASK